jgi:hypothetical protein
MVFSLLAVSVSVGLFFVTHSGVSSMRGAQATDAGAIAAIGTSWAALIFILFLAVCAFASATAGAQGVAWAFLIGWGAAVALAGLGLKGLTQFIDAASTAQSAARVDRSNWTTELALAQNVLTDEDARRVLTQLAEKLRYSASDIPGVTLEVNSRITTEINGLRSLTPQDLVVEASARITALLNEREIELKAKRAGA